MTIWILSFTDRGALTAGEIAAAFPDEDVRTDRFSSLDISLREYADRAFSEADALVFVGACGIAVRAIAPFIRSKMTDPAVLAVDEAAHYVIPILSGHIGGANALARRISSVIGAEAVITTATDIRGAFAVDLFAKKNLLTILDPGGIKEVSSAILAGEKIGLFCELPMERELPQELLPDEPERMNLVIPDTRRGKPASLRTMIEHAEAGGTAKTGMMVLLPKRAVLGVGCRKGASFAEVKAGACQALRLAGTDRRELAAVASLDRKKEENALKRLCAEWGLPFLVYTPEQLGQIPGDFAASEFVRDTAGVGNVCGRASHAGALSFGSAARTLLPKTIIGGAAFAVAEFTRKPIRF